MKSKFVTVKCEILSGAFSGERIVQVATASGDQFVATVPREFCAKTDGSPLGKNEPAPSHPIIGLVKARVIRNGGDTARVAFPDGDDAEIDLGLLAERKVESAHVPV
jgi:hypothetical protein